MKYEQLQALHLQQREQEKLLDAALEQKLHVIKHADHTSARVLAHFDTLSVTIQKRKQQIRAFQLQQLQILRGVTVTVDIFEQPGQVATAELLPLAAIIETRQEPSVTVAAKAIVTPPMQAEERRPQGLVGDFDTWEAKYAKERFALTPRGDNFANTDKYDVQKSLYHRYRKNVQKKEKAIQNL